MNNFSRAMVLQGAENIETVSYNPKMHIPDADSTTCTQEPENAFGFENFQRQPMFSIRGAQGEQFHFFFFIPHHSFSLRGTVLIIIIFFLNMTLLLYTYMYMNK